MYPQYKVETTKYKGFCRLQTKLASKPQFTKDDLISPSPGGIRIWALQNRSLMLDHLNYHFSAW